MRHSLSRRPLALTGLAVACLIPSVASAQWTSATRISNAADTTLSGPVVAVDAEGRATAAWAAYNNTNAWTVQVARYVNGTWSAPTTLSQVGNWAKRPAVGVDGSGNATVVWAESTTSGEGNVWALKAATAPSGGGGWTTTTVDSAAQISGSTTPAIVVEAGGDATVAYARQTGNGPRPHGVRRVAGTWQTPVQIANEYGSDMAMTRTGGGAVVAGWINVAGTIGASTLTGTSGNGTWGTVRSIGSGMNPSVPFSLAAGPSDVVATWASSMSFCFTFPCSYNYYVMSARLDPATGWIDGNALTVTTGGTNGGAVVKADGTVVYSYRESATMKSTPATGGVLGSPTSTLTTTADSARGFTTWLDTTGNPVTAWTNTGTVGIGIATNAGGNWPASGTAPVVALTGADQPRGASGGTVQRPASALVATGSAGVFATTAFTTPAAPSLTSATLTGTSVDVAFQAPGDNGGQAVTGYAATCASSNGGATQSASGASSPITVTGLDAGRTYTCTVTATNASGISPASSPSSAITTAGGASSAPTGSGAAPGTSTTPQPSTSAPATASPTPRRYRLTLGSAPAPVWSSADTGPNQTPSTIRTRVSAPGAGTIRQVAREGSGQAGARESARTRSACATTVRVKAAGQVTVTCRLTPQARATLRTRALRLRVVTTFAGADGSTGVSVRRLVIPRATARAPRTAVTG